MRETRTEQRNNQQSLGATLLAEETLRNVMSTGKPPLPVHKEEPKGEEHWPMFWRIFGTTLLSIAALIAITLYSQVTSGLNEVRNEVSRSDAAHADLIRKDEFNNRVLEIHGRSTSALNSLKELQAATASAMAQRSALLEQQVRAAEEERKELARELQRLRERLAILEGRPPQGHR